jgi:hypothetical protein
MPSSRQLSYTGNPALVEAFIDLLVGEELGVDEGDDWPSLSEQLARTSAERGPILIRTGGWGDINVGIQAAISRFHDRFPGQAEIHDQDEGP